MKKLKPPLNKKRPQPPLQKTHPLNVDDLFGITRVPTAEESSASVLDRMTEDIKMLPLLMEHYGVDNDLDDTGAKYFLLALYLARDYVPGFQYAKPRGRKKSLQGEIELIKRIVDVMIEEKCSLVDACKKLDAEWSNRHTYEQYRHLKKSGELCGILRSMDMGDADLHLIRDGMDIALDARRILKKD